MTTPNTTPPTAASADHPSHRRSKPVRKLLHLLGPLLICLGLGVTYLGAFHHPQPNDMKVALVGPPARTQTLAQSLEKKVGDGLDVVTVADRQEATERLMGRDIAGAFLQTPDAAPELLVAKAGSASTANATENIFRQVADKQGVALKVTDVAPLRAEDSGGGGLFFLLIALSVASYITVLVLEQATDVVSVRARAGLGLTASLGISTIGILLAGPVFDVVDGSYAAIWALGLALSAGVISVGIGLHTFLKDLTPVVLMGLFVMLNLTSAGGLVGPELQNDFYASLHSFWNGAGFLEGARSILYFDNTGLGSHLLVLGSWLAAGVLLMLAATLTEKRRKQVGRPVRNDLRAPAPEEPTEIFSARLRECAHNHVRGAG
ncbi:hypothetical protein [Streptomyces ochraceiscleroticus]|uniref:ABC transporter permease n=1 Tax=Streptomyces ochraceiscleroticus TaxID=47761 RepID=A0ABW1MLI3_9ACTN|nr:hypothetical protein [Streptomyces ochraceiscleroticus]